MSIKILQAATIDYNIGGHPGCTKRDNQTLSCFTSRSLLIFPYKDSEYTMARRVDKNRPGGGGGEAPPGG